jgi:penicillin-binding protein 2
MEARLSNRYLRGERGEQAVIVNARGTKIGEAFFQPEIPGSDVHVTLDRALQSAAEKELAGRRGALVAMRAQTGDILALASSPAFDPGVFAGNFLRMLWSDLTDSSTAKLSNQSSAGRLSSRFGF